MAAESELLFFDTFSHENTEELNLDLVQFPRPVLINEVRVIPLGTRVQVDVPGGTRLGATNPSSFKLDLFVTNLTKPNAATFEQLGTLDYKGNDNIQMVVDEKIPTDGVIIKGWYSAITIALYGCLTTVTRERASPPPPPPPRSKTNQVVIPPAVVDNVPAQPQQLAPAQPAHDQHAQEWDQMQQPFPGAPAGGPPAPPVPPAGVPPPNVIAALDVFPGPTQDVDERFPATVAAAVTAPQATLPQPTEPVKVKEKPQVELDERGEVKIPQGEYESDELFEAYLREKDRKKEEKERERQAALERERVERERYRREGHSATPDRAHSRDHGRSNTRSRSRSTERDSYRRGSREREKDHRDYRPSYRDREGDRDYRDRDSDRDHRDRYDRDRGSDRSKERGDSDRDRMSDSRDDRHDSRDKDRKSSHDRQLKDRDTKGSHDRERERRESVDRPRERTPERERDNRPKSPKSRSSPRRSRSRSPPSRRSRSRSRERDRTYDRSGRNRDSRDGGYSRDRDRDYERNRKELEGRDKTRDYDRARDRDGRERERGDRDFRDRESRDNSRDERPWDYDVRESRDARDRDRYDQRDRDREGRSERDSKDIERNRDNVRDPRDNMRENPRDVRDLARDNPRDLRDNVRDNPRDMRDNPRDMRDNARDNLRDAREGPRDLRDVSRDVRDTSRDQRDVRDARDRGRADWEQDRDGRPNRDQTWNRDQRADRGMQDQDGSTWGPPRQRGDWEAPKAEEDAEEEESWEKQAEELYPAEDEPVSEQAKVHPSNLITVQKELTEDDGTAVYEELVDEVPSSAQLDEMYSGLSDGEIEDQDAYSDISSDENFLDSLDINTAELQNIDMTDDAWNYAISNFNPYQCDLTPMENFTDPSLTDYEVEKQKLLGTDVQAMPQEARDILDIVDKFKTEPHHQEWIESMEKLASILAVGLAYIVNKCDQDVFVEVLDLLIGYALEGLDVTMAMAQPVTAYKVRHLKMGIRLAGALCQCDPYVALRFLSRDVQIKLLDLFESEHMSGSVKIQIVKALDGTTRLKDGLEWFIGKHPLQELKSTPDQSASVLQIKPMNTEDLEPTSKGTGLKTPYQRLIHILTTKQMSRVVVALTALARKIHTFELLNKFASTVETIQDQYERWLAENTPVAASKAAAPGGGSMGGSDDTDMTPEAEPLLVPETAQLQGLDNLVQCLREAINVYLNADYFVIFKEPFDPYPGLYHMMSGTGFLECLFVLLSSPATFTNSGVFSAVKDVLTCLIHRQSGLKYLCAHFETVNGIIRTLTQTQGYSEEEEEQRGPHPAHVLGLQMIYYLQTMQSIDTLLHYHNKDESQKSLDDAEALGVLHNLYLMTFNQLGREAVVQVFTMGDGLLALMPFIEFTDNEEMNVKIKRSVCHSYTAMLLLLIVREATDVTYLQTFGQKLLAFTQQEPSTKTAERVSELHDWLSPLKRVPVFTRDVSTVTDLLKLLKQYNDEIMELPKGLVTVLRIMKLMSIEPGLALSSVESAAPRELKYKFVVIELFHGDCMPMFVNILQKISEMLTRAFQDCIPTMGLRKAVVLATVRPILHMMRAILSGLIAARDSEFQDRTALPCLFHLHTMLCSVSHTGTLPAELQDIQNLIVDILNAYTQPSLKSEQTGDSISKSLWTLMVKDLFDYVVTAPYTFLSGLILVSELLPLPLPIQSKQPLTDSEVLIAVNQRKLWGAHLHPLSSEIQEILKNLSGSACQPLQQLLRRVCWQLADLAAPTALMIVRCLVDTVIESMDASAAEMSLDTIKEDSVDENIELRCSGETAKILNLLAFLMNQAPVKAGFINLTSGKSGVNEDKYTGVLTRLAERLNGVCNKPAHVAAQESIVSIFQSLCDLEVTMVPADLTLSFADQLSNSVPAREQMALICRALLLHVNQPDHSFSSILPALRTLALLMLHDYGFYHVKQALDNVPRAFFNLFERINNTFSKDSSDCIATLSSAIELLQFLVALPEAPDGEEQTVPFERTYLISYSDLRAVLHWQKGSPHPLSDLDSLLHAYAEDEDALKAVYESVYLVVSILKSDEDQVKPEMQEPMLVIQDNLQAQFSLRSIYVVTDEEDDRLSATYWLATPMGEDIEEGTEFVTVDFNEMAHKYCQDFDLKAELEKGAVRSDPPAVKLRRKSRLGRRGHDTINTSKHRAGNRGGFVAPMRGRGFGRGMSMPVSKNDLFRSRPQNTSRPPSMHVDDFIKMELQGTTPAIGPTGMNPHLNQYREKIQSSGGRGRGGYERGRGRGMSDRGGGRGGQRYFGGGPPSKYGSAPPAGGYDGSMVNRGAFGMKPRGMRGHSSATGGYTRGSPPQKASPWGASRPTRPPPSHRNFERSGGEGLSAGGGRGFSRGGWRGGGGGSWRGRDDRRFAMPTSTPQFYRRDRGRHQRSFTK